MDSGLCIYQLVVWWNFNFLHNSQWITFSTQTHLVFTLFALVYCIIIIIIIIIIKRQAERLLSKACYVAMCPVGLQGADRSRQVYQLKQGTHVGCGLSTLFYITDITNSRAEPHFKASKRVIGELLKINTANW